MFCLIFVKLIFAGAVGPENGASSSTFLFNAGRPRMLLVLVREFESHRDEILILFANKKIIIKRDQLTAESA